MDVLSSLGSLTRKAGDRTSLAQFITAGSGEGDARGYIVSTLFVRPGLIVPILIVQ